MRAKLIAATVAFGLVGLRPAHAQDAQERIDPTQLEEREEEDTPSEAAPIYIEPESVLPVAVGTKQYDVGAIVIDGNSALSDEAFLDIIEAYSARTLTESEIAALADAVARRARERGYVLATATIAPQSLSPGVLRVTLEEGSVDEIRVVGVDPDAIYSQLKPLVGSGPVTLPELERRVLIAGDVSGVVIRSTRLEREGDRNVLLVNATREKASASASLRNDGTGAIGPFRARIDADFNGLLAATDEVDLTLSTSVLEPGELQYLAARYAGTVSPDGLQLALSGSYSATRPGAFLRDREILGESWRAELRARYPMLRSRRASMWLEGEFQVRDLRQDRAGIRVQHDRLAVLRAGAFGTAELAGGRLRGRITVARGLDILGATQAGDPLASRSDASGQFTLAEAWLWYRRPLGGNFGLELSARGQVSSDPLLITEDIGLGSPYYLRAYNYNERSGDEGVMGYAELQYYLDKPVDFVSGMQFYGFVDGGVVSDIGTAVNDGSLFSAGGGVRVDITRRLDVDLELAVPLSGPRFDSDGSTPKVNLSVSQDF